MIPVKLVIFLKNRIVDIGLWMFWYPCRKVLQILPLNLSHNIVDKITRTIAPLFFNLKRELIRELKEIFIDIYSDKQLESIAVKSIELDMKRRMEELFFGQYTKQFINKIVTVEGKEFLEESIENGKGTIILLSHFGFFLLILPVLGFMGYPINQMGGPPDLKHHRKIHRKIFEIRKTEYDVLPITFLRVDKHLKKIMKALQNNELLAIAFDGRESGNWARVNFFSRSAYFATGPVKLAQKTGAMILPTFIVRQEDNTHKLIFEPPFQPVETGNKEDFLIENTQRLAGLFERYISEYPSHFAMIFHIVKKRVERDIIDQPIFE